MLKIQTNTDKGNNNILNSNRELESIKKESKDYLELKTASEITNSLIGLTKYS